MVKDKKDACTLPSGRWEREGGEGYEESDQRDLTMRVRWGLGWMGVRVGPGGAF